MLITDDTYPPCARANVDPERMRGKAVRNRGRAAVYSAPAFTMLCGLPLSRMPTMEDIVKHAFDTVIVGLFGTCCFVLAAFYCFPGIRDRVLTRDDERNEHVKTLMASSLWLLLPLSYVVGAVSFALGDQLFNEEPRGLVKVAQVLPDWLGVHVEADSTTRRKRPHISRAPLQSSMLMRMAEASEPASRRPQVIGHPATVMRGRILAKHRVGIDARRSRWRKGILVDSTTHFRPADATRESGRQDRMKSVKRAHAKAAT